MSESSAYQAGYAVGAILGVLLVLGFFGFGLVAIIMAFVRRTTAWIVTAIICGFIVAGGIVTGVVVAARGFSKVAAKQGKAETVVSDDGWVSVEIPGNWGKLPELHESASLKVGNKFREEYAIVISESKEDIAGTLGEFAQAATDGIRKSLGPNAESSPIEDVPLGNSKAKRCRLAGKVEHVRIVYLHYSIETSEGFHQLIMWTLPTKERGAWPVFERVAASFAEKTRPTSATPGLEKGREQQRRVSPRTGTVEERLRAIVAEQLGVPAEKVSPTARLKADLGADDLATVELIMAAEEEFGLEIGDDDADKLVTVRDFAEYISARGKK